MCSNVINNDQVNSYSQNSTPTPNYLPTCLPPESTQKAQYSMAAKALLGTVDLDVHNIHNWAILDLGATSHFLVTAAPTCHKEIAQTPLKVQLPDGGHVTSTHTCNLDLPKFSIKAQLGHIINNHCDHSRENDDRYSGGHHDQHGSNYERRDSGNRGHQQQQ